MGKSKQSATMILTYKILVYFATTLAGIEASAPRLREDQKCGIFSQYLDPSELSCRSGANILKNMANWTELAETELIENRWRLVIPYVIKPKFSDKPASFWKRQSPGGAKPANAEEWIAKVRPVIKKAAAFYESTNVFFREYSQSDIESGRFDEKQYIVVSDFYDPQSSGCTADVGPNLHTGYVEVDIEGCRNEKGVGSQYHPGLIAHEFMHILGFLHEHQRQDRDRYLKVTLLPSYGALDYRKDERGRILTPYDPESITHYGPDECIKINSDHPKSTNMKLIGQREKLSKLDIEQINLNYPVASSMSVFITDPVETTNLPKEKEFQAALKFDLSGETCQMGVLNFAGGSESGNLDCIRQSAANRRDYLGVPKVFTFTYAGEKAYEIFVVEETAEGTFDRQLVESDQDVVMYLPRGDRITEGDKHLWVVKVSNTSFKISPKNAVKTESWSLDSKNRVVTSDRQASRLEAELLLSDGVYNIFSTDSEGKECSIRPENNSFGSPNHSRWTCNNPEDGQATKFKIRKMRNLIRDFAHVADQPFSYLVAVEVENNQHRLLNYVYCNWIGYSWPHVIYLPEVKSDIESRYLQDLTTGPVKPGYMDVPPKSDLLISIDMPSLADSSSQTGAVISMTLKSAWSFWTINSENARIEKSSDPSKFFLRKVNSLPQTNAHSPIDGSKSVFITDFEGKVFDVQDRDFSGGAKILLWNRHGGSNQQFKVDNADNGYYFIRSGYVSKAGGQ